VFEHILVPLDGSRRAEIALSQVCGLLLGSTKVTLLAVADPAEMYIQGALEGCPPQQAPLSLAPTVDAATAKLRSAFAKLDAELLEYLRQKALALRNRGIKVECAVEWGDASIQIPRYARTNHVDLIVMTTHGRTGSGRLVFGSVAEAVLRSGVAPILIVRPTELVDALLCTEAKDQLPSDGRISLVR
jgi:nucleotide-binding universal stress UspA family protein